MQHAFEEAQVETKRPQRTEGEQLKRDYNDIFKVKFINGFLKQKSDWKNGCRLRGAVSLQTLAQSWSVKVNKLPLYTVSANSVLAQ